MPETIDEFSAADFAPQQDEFSISDFAPARPIPAADVASDINATIGAGLLPSKILTAPGVAEASAMGQEQGRAERAAAVPDVVPASGEERALADTNLPKPTQAELYHFGKGFADPSTTDLKPAQFNPVELARQAVGLPPRAPMTAFQLERMQDERTKPTSYGEAVDRSVKAAIGAVADNPELAVGAIVAPEIVEPYLAYQGVRGVEQNLPRVFEGGRTGPERLESAANVAVNLPMVAAPLRRFLPVRSPNLPPTRIGPPNLPELPPPPPREPARSYVPDAVRSPNLPPTDLGAPNLPELPSQPKPTLESVDAKVRRGEPLSANEQKVLDDANLIKPRAGTQTPVAPEITPELTPAGIIEAANKAGRLTTDIAYEAGRQTKTVAHLDDLLAGLKEVTANAAEHLKAIRAETDPAKRMELMRRAFGGDLNPQYYREAIEAATDLKSASNEMRAKAGEPTWDRPLDWKKNPEVADWLRKNAKDIYEGDNYESLPDALKGETKAAVAETKPAVAATEPPKAATPAAAPAVEQAAAKVEAQVDKVAATEGQRPAKEVKSELVSRIEQSIESAPSTSEVDAVQKVGKSGVNLSAWPKDKPREITIDIPGDGTFKIPNTKEALQKILARAKALKTTSTEPVKTRSSGTSKADREWVAQQVAAQPQAEAPKAKGIAASVRNKWTSATDDAAPLGSEAGFINLDVIRDFVDSVTPHVKNAFLAVKDIARETSQLTRMTDYRRAVLGWSAKLQRSFGEAAAAQREITKAVPNPERRDGITNWIQADGDYALLVRRLNDTAAWRDPVTGKPHPQQKRLIAGYEAAISLTPEEIAVANDARAAYRALGQRGQKYNVLKSFKDNYVTQVWNLARGPQGTGSSRTLKDRFKFSRASTFPTFFDGEQAGYVPKTKDISKLLPVYLHEMNSVIAARQLVKDLSGGFASDGEPLVKARGVGVPVEATEIKPGATLVMPKASKASAVNYRTLPNQPALSDWIWASNDTAGNPVFLKADLALHPEAYNRIKAVLGRSAIRDWYSTRTSAVAEIPKLLARGLDAANSETKRTMLGFASPFHQVQEGTHALGHRVNPAFNIPKIDLVNDAGQMDAAKHGLMMLPDRASESQFMEGFRPSGIISRIPGIGPISDFYSNYLFHEYIPGIKYKTYQSVLDRNLKVYAKDLAAGKFAPEDVKTLSAEQVNAAFGHLNYADLGRNPTIQHIAQLVLLAPDFLEGRARFAAQAIKGVTGAKVGREQLIALAVLAIGQAALAYTSAQLTGGKWDASRPFEFTRGNRRYTMRSVPEDISSLLHNTRLFVHSRLSPLLGKGTLQYLSGVNALGKKVSAGETTKELAEQPIPISVRGFAGIGPSTLSGMEQLAGAVGLKISRFNPEQPKIDAAMKINEFADSIRGEARKLPISQRYQFVKERMAKDKMSVAEQSKVIHKLRQQGTFRYQ